MRNSYRKLGIAGLPICLALALAGCGESAEKTYEVDATDESGGELIVSEVDPEAVPVDTPDTEMVNVPADEGGDATATE